MFKKANYKTYANGLRNDRMNQSLPERHIVGVRRMQTTYIHVHYYMLILN